MFIFEHFLPKTSKNLGIFLSIFSGGKGKGGMKMIYSAFNDRMNLLAERPSLREKVRLIQAAAQKAEWVETALEHKRLADFVYTARI
jgi:hypothetical protein